MESVQQSAGLPAGSQPESKSPERGESRPAGKVGWDWPAAWWTTGLPILLMCLLAAVSAYLAVRRHDALHTSFFDTGSYTQLVWNLAHGRWFVWSHAPPNYLGDHFSPLLAVLAPLFWLAPDARTLQVVGMLALATCVVPGYLILRARHPSLGPLLVLGLSFNPLLHAAASEDIHTIFLAAPTVGLALYALHGSRYGLMVAALALALLAREDMPVCAASFGLFLFLYRPRGRWLGFAVGTGAVAWLLATTLAIMPALNEGVYRHGGQFQGMLATLRDSAAAVAAEPLSAIPRFLTSRFALSLAMVLLPLAAVPLLAGGYSLLWAPGLLILLLSPEADKFGSGHGWRLAPLLPLWFGATAIAISRLERRRALLATLAVVACSLVSFALWSQYPGGGRFDEAKYGYDERTQTLKAILQRVPPDFAVAATDHLGAQLGTRERHYLFPFFRTDNRPDIAIVDVSGGDLYPLSSPAEQQAAVDALRLDPAVKAIWYQDEVFVFSFVDESPFPHNYGVPMRYYAEALAKAQQIGAEPGKCTIYFRVFGDIADDIAAAVQRMGRENGQSVRVVTQPDALLLAGGDEVEHLYVVESGDAQAVARLRQLGFTEVERERIDLPGGEQSLRFYRLPRAAGALAEAGFDREGPNLRLSNGLLLRRWRAPVDLRGERSLTLAAAWEVWDAPTAPGDDPDYCVSQHLVDINGQDLAVADARFTPTRYLQKGDLLLTWSEIPLPADLELQQAWLQLGMFTCWQRHSAVALDAAGEKAADALQIGPFKAAGTVLTEDMVQPQYEAQVHLGDDIHLVGYDVALGVDHRSDTIYLSLYWLAEACPHADCTVFVQLLDDEGVVAQQDNLPRSSAYPTTLWSEGEFVADEYVLALPDDMAVGDYRLIAGMYTASDGHRLPVRDADGRPLGDAVALGTVSVTPAGEVSFRQEAASG